MQAKPIIDQLQAEIPATVTISGTERKGAQPIQVRRAGESSLQFLRPSSHSPQKFRNQHNFRVVIASTHPCSKFSSYLGPASLLVPCLLVQSLHPFPGPPLGALRFPLSLFDQARPDSPGIDASNPVVWSSGPPLQVDLERANFDTFCCL